MISSILLFISSCAGVRVETDYDQDFNFSKLSTYAGARGSLDPEDASSKTLVSKRIRKHVREALNQKGYKLVEKDEADFLVDFMYKSKEVMVPNAIYPSVGIGFGARRSFGGFGMGYGGYRRGEVEVLRIEIWDAKSKSHIWTAESKEDLVASKQEKTQENFRKVIHAMMEKFPPQK